MKLQRSVADILGYHYPDAPQWEAEITVDDLLAWLLRAADEQDGVDFAAYWTTVDNDDAPARTFSVHISISDDDGHPHTRSFTGPTLLEALRKAVVETDRRA